MVNRHDWLGTLPISCSLYPYRAHQIKTVTFFQVTLLLLVIGIVLYRYIVEILNFRGWDTWWASSNVSTFFWRKVGKYLFKTWKTNNYCTFNQLNCNKFDLESEFICLLVEYYFTKFLNDLGQKPLFKDIVQPNQRGVKRGTNRFASTSYTITDVF